MTGARQSLLDAEFSGSCLPVSPPSTFGSQQSHILVYLTSAYDNSFCLSPLYDGTELTGGHSNVSSLYRF